MVVICVHFSYSPDIWMSSYNNNQYHPLLPLYHYTQNVPIKQIYICCGREAKLMALSLFFSLPLSLSSPCPTSGLSCTANMDHPSTQAQVSPIHSVPPMLCPARPATYIHTRTRTQALSLTHKCNNNRGNLLIIACHTEVKVQHPQMKFHFHFHPDISKEPQDFILSEMGL